MSGARPRRWKKVEGAPAPRPSGGRRLGLTLPRELWAWLALSLLVAALMVMAVANLRLMWRVKQAQADPAARLEYALDILGARGLPPGYYAGDVFILSLKPFMYGETLELTDRPPGKGPGFHARGFIYHHFSDENALQNQQMRDLMRTRNGVRFDGWLKTVRVEGRELIRSGRIDGAGGDVEYVTQRGILVHPDGDVPSIVTVMAIHCADMRTRTALWFGPDPAPATPIDAADWSATPADEGAMQALLGYFKLCHGDDG